MQKLVALLVVSLVIFSGCNSREDQRAPVHPLDRAREGQSVTEQSAVRDSGTAVEPGERRVVSDEKSSLLVSVLLSWSWWILYHSIGVLIGLIIYRDAQAKKQLAMNIRPIWWFLIAAIDAAIGLLVYWVMNYSTLAPKSAGEEGKSDSRL
jgi:hypothetical protein